MTGRRGRKVPAQGVGVWEDRWIQNRMAERSCTVMVGTVVIHCIVVQDMDLQMRQVDIVERRSIVVKEGIGLGDIVVRSRIVNVVRSHIVIHTALHAQHLHTRDSL